MPALLLLGFMLGIVWADRNFGAPCEALVAVVSMGRGPIAWALVIASLVAGPQILRMRTGSHRRSMARGGIGFCVALVCLLLAFGAGAARLGKALEAAARDAKWAEAASTDSPAAHRIVEARVDARRTTAWGEELILIGVRGVDGRGPVPRALLLWIGDRGGSGVRSASWGRRGAGKGEFEEKGGTRAERLLWPGAIARLALRIRPIQSRRNPGTPDRERAWARRALGARARLVDPDWVLLLERPGRGFEDRLRAWIPAARDRWRSAIAERFSRSGLEGGLARALAVGDRSGLSSRARESFRELGLSHLIAVSGLHVGLVGGLTGWIVLRVLAVVRFSFAPGAMPFGVSLAAATGMGGFYAWLTGASISAQRAALLFVLFALARSCGRILTPGRALAACALGLLAVDPASLFDLGSELSFGACLALIVSGFWREEKASSGSVSQKPSSREAFSKWLGDAFSLSIAVSLATAPLLLASGLPLSPVSPMLNLLAVPWVGFVLLPSSLAAAIASSWLPTLPVGVLLFPAHLFEGGVVLLAQWQPRLTPIDGLPIWAAAGIAGSGLLAMRGGLRGFALVGWIVLAVVGAAPVGSDGEFAQRPRVVFFDVGQGDATLVEGEAGTMLIDTGGGPADGTGGTALIRGLRSLGVVRLDVLVVTHGDLDHRAGAARILKRLRVRELWLPSGGEDDERLAELAEIARRRLIAVRWLEAGASGMDRGDLAIDVLWPMPGQRPAASTRRSRNENSLVLRIGIAGVRILLSADIGGEVEARLIEDSEFLDADILKVGHHGSRHSTTPAFLEAVSPTHAVISAPCDPARGLPNEQVFDRLMEAGVSIWWTGRDGAVSLNLLGRGVGLDFAGWGERRRCRGAPFIS
ncbi:MAG: MBL fold metallo-hydrolase [bacterium]|nr:MBL fold metallo-hydrolase [bacterium]